VTLHSGELRDLWQRLQLARETIEDIRYLIGPLDRDQAARFGLFQTMAASSSSSPEENHGRSR